MNTWLMLVCSLPVSLSRADSLRHTHTCACARAHTHTHIHKYINIQINTILIMTARQAIYYTGLYPPTAQIFNDLRDILFGRWMDL
jgi:hypothetical protein